MSPRLSWWMTWTHQPIIEKEMAKNPVFLQKRIGTRIRQRGGSSHTGSPHQGVCRRHRRGASLRPIYHGTQNAKDDAHQQGTLNASIVSTLAGTESDVAGGKNWWRCCFSYNRHCIISL